MAFRLQMRDTAAPVSIDAWRARARAALPELAWAYVDGGADDHVTMNANLTAFAGWRLRQRCLTRVVAPDLQTDMAGVRMSMPVALAPTGAAGLSHWSGDVAATRAAEQAGIRAVLSTASSYKLEEVAEATEHNHWFQLYPFGNRERVAALMDRAHAAGYTALFVTVDVAVIGNRESERRAGMTAPWTLTPSRILNMVRKPSWLANAVGRRRLAAIHFLEEQPDGSPPPRPSDALRRALSGADDAVRSAEAQARYMQGDLHWDDLQWMRDRWKGPLYVKGILDPDDAAQAVDQIGAQGVVVSNHGGRQLDRALASIDALPAIVERVGDRAEVYLDGGVRRGTDIVTALCLGARGVFIGRPYLYGLAAAGEAGVASVLEIFRSELARALVLMGCPAAHALDRSWIIPNPHVSSGTYQARGEP